MTDIVSKAVRSKMMSSTRSQNTCSEMAVRRYLHGKDFHYRPRVENTSGLRILVI